VERCHRLAREVSTADTNKVKRDFNWEPKIDKNEGINRMTTKWVFVQ